MPHRKPPPTPSTPAPAAPLLDTVPPPCTFNLHTPLQELCQGAHRSRGQTRRTLLFAAGADGHVVCCRKALLSRDIVPVACPTRMRDLACPNQAGRFATALQWPDCGRNVLSSSPIPKLPTSASAAPASTAPSSRRSSHCIARARTRLLSEAVQTRVGRRRCALNASSPDDSGRQSRCCAPTPAAAGVLCTPRGCVNCARAPSLVGSGPVFRSRTSPPLPCAAHHGPRRPGGGAGAGRRASHHRLGGGGRLRCWCRLRQRRVVHRAAAGRAQAGASARCHHGAAPACESRSCVVAGAGGACFRPLAKQCRRRQHCALGHRRLVPPCPAGMRASRVGAARSWCSGHVCASQPEQLGPRVEPATHREQNRAPRRPSPGPVPAPPASARPCTLRGGGRIPSPLTLPARPSSPRAARRPSDLRSMLLDLPVRPCGHRRRPCGTVRNSPAACSFRPQPSPPRPPCVPFPAPASLRCNLCGGLPRSDERGAVVNQRWTAVT